jgi:hypothetical protein
MVVSWPGSSDRIPRLCDLGNSASTLSRRPRSAEDSRKPYGAWPFILINSRIRPPWSPERFSKRTKYLTSGAYQY